MSNFFVDTSALAKRYLLEGGSTWVTNWIEPSAGNVIIIADTTTIEMFSLLTRRVREGSLTLVDMASLQADVLFHAEHEYIVALLDQKVLIQARELVNRYPLRTLDAIQLASAVYALGILQEPITFVSGDQNLLTYAQAEGFVIENPNRYP